MPAIALTDHGNMFGIKDFFDYVNRKNKSRTAEGKSPFKPILGCEVYVARRSMAEKSTKEDGGGYHLVLLAKNKKGYQNLCKLVSASWLEGYYYKPRIDKEILEKYSEGLIALSACLGGEIPQKLLGKNAKNVDDESVAEQTQGFEADNTILESNIKDAEEAISWHKKVFGDDFYLEIQRHKTDKKDADQDIYRIQQIVNVAIIDLARKTDTKLIATNDIHFVDEEHAEAHDRLICLSTGKDLTDTKRMRFSKQEWLKTTEEMAQIFSDLPEALENTLEIVNKVEFYTINNDALMPEYAIPPDFGTMEEYKNKFSEQDLRTEFGDRFEPLAKDGLNKVYRIKLEADYLEKLTMEGAKTRYGNNISEETMERIRFELNTMKTMGYPGYFLIVQDFINAGREMGVSVGPGRGSAAGSVVAYCLRITDLDPLKYGLLFERFLNPDRISMPDIDVDFEADGRGKVLQWVTKKYGAEKVARVITYGTMATKSSIKDVARVQKLPLPEAERLVKLIPDKFPKENGVAPKINVKNCIERVPELREARHSADENLSDTLKYAEMLEGTVRQTGIHACAVIIGTDDLSNFVPLSTAEDKETKEKIAITQYEGGTIEDIGLIKMDFLGLETLDIIKGTLQNIKNSKGIDIDIDKIPLDDAKTYELFSSAQTTGIFQFESPGMQKSLRELKPTSLDDLIAMNALYRPGPMDYIPSFINRKYGREAISYDLPIMENRLKETYGITVYQEQVMLLSGDLANFTRGESDTLRKAMGKKDKQTLDKMKPNFIEGGKKNGHNEKILEKIWSDWERFAEYAFNKSHSACYSVLAYQTGYLKAHYPSEFMAAILTRSLNDIKEVSKFMDECKNLGIKVLEPDVNESDLNFTVNKAGDIRFGLGAIKNVGQGAVMNIIDERTKNGAFKDIFDFTERINLLACNKKNIESLALSGAFDSFSGIRREQFLAKNSKGEEFIDTIIRYGNKFQQDKHAAQISLFGDDSSFSIARPEIPTCEKWSDLVRLSRERELIGIYLSAHPLDDYEFILRYVCNVDTQKLQDLDKLNGKEVSFGGMVTPVREGQTKNGNPFTIFKIEDYSGSFEVALFSDDSINYGKFARQGLSVYITARVQPRQWGKGEIELKISSINLLSDVKERLVKKITLQIPVAELNDAAVSELSAVIKNNSGNALLYFDIIGEKSRIQLFSRQTKIRVNKQFIDSLVEQGIEFQIN
jgi:DNA polymerase-3 subunit alpha